MFEIEIVESSSMWSILTLCADYPNQMFEFRKTSRLCAIDNYEMKLNVLRANNFNYFCGFFYYYKSFKS